MILRNIVATLTTEDSSEEIINYHYSFKKKSRHILNYIRRNCLKPLKFNSDYYDYIGLDLRYNVDSKFMNIEPYISPTNTLIIPSEFNKEEYDNLKTDDQFREFLYQVLRDSLQLAEKKYDIPVEMILNSYQELKEKKYVNEWLFKKKVDRKNKIIAELYCSLTMDRFQLTLNVSHNKHTVFNQVILETDPDEVAFEYRFKDIKFESDRIVIKGIRSNVLMELPLKEIL